MLVIIYFIFLAFGKGNAHLDETKISIFSKLLKLYDCKLVGHVWSRSLQDADFAQQFSFYGDLPLITFSPGIGDITDETLNNEDRICFTSFNITELQFISLNGRKKRSVKILLPLKDKYEEINFHVSTINVEEPPMIIATVLDKGNSNQLLCSTVKAAYNVTLGTD